MPPLPSGPAEASRGCPVGLGAGGGWERSPAGRVPRPAQGSHPPPPFLQAQGSASVPFIPPPWWFGRASMG